MTNYELLNLMSFANSKFEADRVVKYPFNEYVEKTELGQKYVIEIAAVGAEKENIKVELAGNVLQCNYTPENRQPKENIEYIKNGIVKRAFDFKWKLSPILDLSKIEVNFNNGLITIQIPYKPEEQPKQLQIN